MRWLSLKNKYRQCKHSQFSCVYLCCIQTFREYCFYTGHARRVLFLYSFLSEAAIGFFMNEYILEELKLSFVNKSKKNTIKPNSYINKIDETKDNQHLISMVPVSEILRLGYELGLNENSKVLDLCCGYGTVLKVWAEAFAICATGVDICKDFIHTGKKRLKECGIHNVKLIHKDVTKYKDDTKYDIVICSETIESIESTFQLGENFLKKGGTLLYQKVFSTAQDVPKELDEFDGGVYPLTKLNKIFNDLGYYITHFATGTENDWNRYYTWSVRRDIDKLRKKPNNQELKKQIDSWNYMHLKYRMPYENQALFGL